MRLIKSIIDVAHKSNIKVGMCGEMSGEPNFAVLLLGLGLDEFSMPASAVPRIKQIIRAVTTKQAEEIARQALNLSEGKEVEKFVNEQLQKILPKFYSKS